MERRLPALKEITILDGDVPSMLPHLNLRQTPGGVR
jgi:hypothetical protein